MKKTVDLYNFDHAFKEPGKIEIDEFEINITKEQCKNLALLERGTKTHFGHSPTDGSRVVKKLGPTHGQYVVTATVLFDDTIVAPSILYYGIGGNTKLNDLCAVLSGLTGRLVLLENDLERRPSVKKIDGMATKEVFSRKKISLCGLQKLSENGLAIPFLNLCYAPNYADLFPLAAIVNSIINAVYERWCAASGFTKYTNKTAIDAAIKAATDAAAASLESEGVDQQTIQDITGRIRIDKSPSAILKLTEFLRGNNFLFKPVSDAAKKNIKMINVIRNALIHAGSLPTNTEFETEQLAEICVQVTILLLTVVQVYFAKNYFGLEQDQWVISDTRNVQEFFNEGIFRGKKIYTEKYEDFVTRVEEEWIAEGKLP